MEESLLSSDDRSAEHGNKAHLSVRDFHDLARSEPVRSPRSPLLSDEEQEYASSTQASKGPSENLLNPLVEEIISPASEKTEVHRFNQILQDTWALEMASCGLAVLSLFAIIVLLALHQNEPLPNWPQLITINSLLSVFSTLLKIGLALPLSQGECPEHSFQTSRC
jgi:hypothetical protein